MQITAATLSTTSNKNNNPVLITIRRKAAPYSVSVELITIEGTEVPNRTFDNISTLDEDACYLAARDISFLLHGGKIGELTVPNCDRSEVRELSALLSQIGGYDHGL